MGGAPGGCGLGWPCCHAGVIGRISRRSRRHVLVFGRDEPCGRPGEDGCSCDCGCGDGSMSRTFDCSCTLRLAHAPAQAQSSPPTTTTRATTPAVFPIVTHVTATPAAATATTMQEQRQSHMPDCCGSRLPRTLLKYRANCHSRHKQRCLLVGGVSSV